MAEEEEKNFDVVGEILDGFGGLTTFAIEELNSVLKAYDDPAAKRKAVADKIPAFVREGSIEDLDDLKERSRKGLFRYSKTQGRLLITGKMQGEILKNAGLSVSKYGLTSRPSITAILQRAVEMTEELRVAKAAPPKKKAVAERRTEQTPVITTACGETFDPNRCLLKTGAGESSYSWQKVQDFMTAYRLHQPKVSDPPGDQGYKTYCDILRTHWTRYMTAALIDAFGDPDQTLPTREELERMAIMNGIKHSAKIPDQELAKALIRIMVTNILTIDAAQYGLGDAAGQIVDSLFSGSVKLSELPTKTRLATIMLASRFSKKILDYVNLQEDPELDREFQNFQQGLVNLRQSVENLNSKQSAAVVSKLASTIAQTESASEKAVAKSVSSKTTSPVPTRKRRSADIANAIENLTFADNPSSTFRHFASILSDAKILEEVAKSDKPLIILLTPDHILKELLFKSLDITPEQFGTLPSVCKALRSMVLKKVSLSAGRVEGMDGSKYTVTKLSGKFRIAETGKGELFASEDGSQYSDVTFYEASGIFLGNFLDQIVAEVEELFPIKKTVPKKTHKVEPVVVKKQPPKRTPVVNKSAPPRKTPQVEEEEEPVVAKKTVPKKTPVVVKKTPKVEQEEEPEEPQPATKTVPKKNPAVVAKRKENACERVFAEYKNKKVSKIGTMLLGVDGIFGDLHDQEADLLRNDVPAVMEVIDATEKFTHPMDADMVNFLIDLREALEKGRTSNPIFNPSINFNDLSGTCKALTDLISGKTAPVKKVQVKAQPGKKSTASKKTQQAEEPEEGEESNLAAFLVDAGFDQFMAIAEATGEPILTQKQLVIFAPTDEAIANFLDSFDMDLESFLARQDLVDAIVRAHYAEALSISDEYTMADDETVHETEEDPIINEADFFVYSIDEVSLNSQARSILLGETEEVPTEQPKATKTQVEESRKPCEQIIQMVDLFGRNPSTMQEFFEDPEIGPLTLNDVAEDAFGDAYIKRLEDSLGEGSDASGFLTSQARRYLFQATQGYLAGIGSEKAEDFQSLAFDCDGWGKLEIAGAQHKVTGGVAKVARSVMPPVEQPKKSGSAVVASIRMKGTSPHSKSPEVPRMVAEVAQEEEEGEAIEL